MALREKVAPPATASGVVRIVGPLEDGAITSIILTRATEAEVLEAVRWFTTDEGVGVVNRRTRTGRAAQVYDILAAEAEDDEDLDVPVRALV